MNKREADALVVDLTGQKNELEKEIAVLSSELKTQQDKLEESSSKVEEIVGSTDVESVENYLDNLEKDMLVDINKLKEME